MQISFTTKEKNQLHRRHCPPSQIERVESEVAVLLWIVVDLYGEVLDAAEVEEEVAVDVEAAGRHEAQVQAAVAHVLQGYIISRIPLLTYRVTCQVYYYT